MKRRNRQKKKGQKALMIFGAPICFTLLFAIVSVRAQSSGVPIEPAPRQAEQCLLDVPFLSQTEEWPTGCESVCAVMALQYAGVDVSVEKFVDEFLPLGEAPHWDANGTLVGCDPRKEFPGDPRSQDGWGCYAPVIRDAVQRLLESGEEGLSVEDLTGQTLDSLCGDWVSQGTPVLVWATIGMEEPAADAVFAIQGTGETFQWIYPMHCLLLVGWNREGYFFNDPLEGKNIFYNREDVQRAFQALGQQALAVLPA